MNFDDQINRDLRNHRNRRTRRNLLSTGGISSTAILNLINSLTNEIETHRPTNNVLNTSLYDKPKFKTVISEKGRSSIRIANITLEKRLYSEEEKPYLHSATTCPITQDDFEENEIVAILPCNHVFSKKAIFNWLDHESSKCPICRYELDSKEIKVEDDEEASTSEDTSLNYLPSVPVSMDFTRGRQSPTLTMPTTPITLYNSVSSTDTDTSMSYANASNPFSLRFRQPANDTNPFNNFIEYIQHQNNIIENRRLQSVIMNSFSNASSSTHIIENDGTVLSDYNSEDEFNVLDDNID